MTKDDFELAIQKLFAQATQEELEIDSIYSVLHGQALIAETILKLSIEQSYKARWN